MTIEQTISEPQRAILKSQAKINLFLAGVGCFHGDTLVRTMSGYTPIRDIEIGDRVLTFNEATKNTEIKRVVNKYCYKTGDIKQKCSIFVLNNNTKFICTDEHRFYFRGTWATIKGLAERKMEADTRNEGQVLCEQYGQNINPKMAQRTYPSIYETGIRQERLSENNDTQKWEVSHNKDAQRNCKSIYSQSPEQTDNKSYQWNKDGQSHREPGMGNTVGECVSCVCDGIGEQRGRATSKTQINRCDCVSRERTKEGWNDIQENRGRTRIRKVHNKRLLYPELAAREISIDEIKHFEPIDCPIVYDLEVEDNHNFCITEENIIVHNSGKTHLAGIKTYQLIKRFPKVRGFIGANTYLQLQQSTLFRIREYWKSIGIVEYEKGSRPYGQYIVSKKPPAHFNTEGHNFDDYYGIISFCNGCVIFIGSLDHAEAHEGKEMGWAVLDETKDTDESDVKEIILARLRQRGMFIHNGELCDEGTPEEQYNPLFITTSPAKTPWINEWFTLDSFVDEIAAKIYSRTDYFKKSVGDKFVTISSTYHNVHNVGENYIQSIIDNNTEEKSKALIFGNPFATTGGEFYSSFNRIEHVDNLKYDPDRPLHVSFDQNSVPYNSCSIWQFEQKDDIWWAYCIDEIALENPRNSTEEVCEELSMRYPNHKAGLFYYGDASGRARSTMNKDFRHHYEIIEFKLRRYLVAKSDRTVTKNPPLVKRRDFINRIFENKLPIRIRIDESCKKMIADMLYVKQAIDGGKDKHIVTDKVTGDRYQKYGHLSDGADYLITEAFNNYFEA